MPVQMTDEGYRELMASIGSVEEQLVKVVCLDYVFVTLQCVIILLIIMDQVCTISIKEHYLPWFKGEKAYAAQKDDAGERDCRV